MHGNYEAMVTALKSVMALKGMRIVARCQVAQSCLEAAADKGFILDSLVKQTA